jgi:hypothetical protein
VADAVKVGILAAWSDSLTYTMARALAFAGHEVEVWVADFARDLGSSWSLSSRIALLDGATVVHDDGTRSPSHLDVLVVQGNPLLLKYRQPLDRLAAVADSITAVSAGDRSRPYRQALALQWREWRWYGRWFAKVRRIAYKDGHYPVDWLGSMRSRRVVGFDAHSKFLQDDALFRAIHREDWSRDAVRPYRANFVGSRDPDARGRILDSVESQFVGPGSVPRMVWHAYSDAKPAALSPLEFLQVLTDSDFTLAPPGYSLVTHRPVEALLRGSIPVLHTSELDLYDLQLTNGVNCIAVPPGAWPAAIRRIVAMDQGEIVAMRHRVLQTMRERVTYSALARAMAGRLAVGRK